MQLIQLNFYCAFVGGELVPPLFWHKWAMHFSFASHLPAVVISFVTKYIYIAIKLISPKALIIGLAALTISIASLIISIASLIISKITKTINIAINIISPKALLISLATKTISIKALIIGLVALTISIASLITSKAIKPLAFKPLFIEVTIKLIETAAVSTKKQTKHFTADLKTLAFAYHLMMASHISTKKKALWIRTHQHPP